MAALASVASSANPAQNNPVIPAQAGIQLLRTVARQENWIPAFAGMTGAGFTGPPPAPTP
ncbi:MAG: hypothetical protein DCF31_09475 [Alphaproteobacteria bacterium]|nr:MAG: hypothetical protein DCF31_09475 [Alphaproteobacteria bacterium]